MVPSAGSRLNATCTTSSARTTARTPGVHQRPDGSSVRLSVTAVTGTTGDVHEDLRHTSRLVHVPSGSTSVRVKVPVVRDGLDEETERFDLGLTDAEGLRISGQAVEVAVQDRDRPPKVAGEPVTVAEGNGRREIDEHLGAAGKDQELAAQAPLVMGKHHMVEWHPGRPRGGNMRNHAQHRQSPLPASLDAHLRLRTWPE